jgi:hypothetical protein
VYALISGRLDRARGMAEVNAALRELLAGMSVERARRARRRPVRAARRRANAR